MVLAERSLLLVYHSQSGNTERLAQAVAEGARQEPRVNLIVKHAFEASAEDIIAADGLLLGTPENLGYMAGAVKDFFDRTYYVVQPLQLCLPYALFVSAGNDGSGAVREIDRIMLGYPMKKAVEPIIVMGEVDALALQQCRELGEAFASALQMNLF